MSEQAIVKETFICDKCGDKFEHAWPPPAPPKLGLVSRVLWLLMFKPLAHLIYWLDWDGTPYLEPKIVCPDCWEKWYAPRTEKPPQTKMELATQRREDRERREQYAAKISQRRRLAGKPPLANRAGLLPSQYVDCPEHWVPWGFDGSFIDQGVDLGPSQFSVVAAVLTWAPDSEGMEGRQKQRAYFNKLVEVLGLDPERNSAFWEWEEAPGRTWKEVHAALLAVEKELCLSPCVVSHAH